MIRRPPRSTLDRSSAASDVYKRQQQAVEKHEIFLIFNFIIQCLQIMKIKHHCPAPRTTLPSSSTQKHGALLNAPKTCQSAAPDKEQTTTICFKNDFSHQSILYPKPSDKELATKSRCHPLPATSPVAHRLEMGADRLRCFWLAQPRAPASLDPPSHATFLKLLVCRPQQCGRHRRWQSGHCARSSHSPRPKPPACPR